MPNNVEDVLVSKDIMNKVENVRGEFPENTENQEQRNDIEVEHNEDTPNWLIKELDSPLEV